MYQGDEDIHRAVQAGAVAYLLKDTVPEVLIRVIRDVHAGRRVFPPEILAAIERRAGQPELTSREVQVLELLAEGKRTKEIAAALGVTIDTANAHIKNIYSKFAVHGRPRWCPRRSDGDSSAGNARRDTCCSAGRTDWRHVLAVRIGCARSLARSVDPGTLQEPGLGTVVVCPRVCVLAVVNPRHPCNPRMIQRACRSAAQTPSPVFPAAPPSCVATIVVLPH